jgi:predicted MFS family arabinose efflux permease
MEQIPTSAEARFPTLWAAASAHLPPVLRSLRHSTQMEDTPMKGLSISLATLSLAVTLSAPLGG